jgi:hypothetical protein
VQGYVLAWGANPDGEIGHPIGRARGFVVAHRAGVVDFYRAVANAQRFANLFRGDVLHYPGPLLRTFVKLITYTIK